MYTAHVKLVWKYVSYLAVIALFFITLGIWGAVWAATPPGVLTVAVMDVGQGDSIFIESPTGVQVVIDGGPDDSLLTQLPTFMSLADRSIDAAIETHPDADHITGFIDLLNRYTVKNFIEPGIPKDTLTAKRLEEEIDQNNIPRSLARRGMTLDLGGGAQLDVLFPDFDVSKLSSDKANEGCIVSHLRYGSTSVLFMCDAPMDIENHLMQIGSSTDLVSNILKVGHHGSRFSTGDAFVALVHPQIGIISVGAHNTYGHPTQQTLGTLLKHNIKTLRTDQEGTIVFKSNGKEFVRSK